MIVKILRDIKIGGKSYKKGEIIRLSHQLLKVLSGIVEPVNEEEALLGNVNLPIYIKEFRYLDKRISDVLILSREQLLSCLRDPNYGEAFQAYLKSMV